MCSITGFTNVIKPMISCWCKVRTVNKLKIHSEDGTVMVQFEFYFLLYYWLTYKILLTNPIRI